MACTRRRGAGQLIRQKPRRARRGDRVGRGESRRTRRRARGVAGAPTRGDGAGLDLPPRASGWTAAAPMPGTSPPSCPRGGPTRLLTRWAHSTFSTTGRYPPSPQRWWVRPASSTATATPGRRFALASVTKPLVARAAQVAIEEGAFELDTPAGPPGSTVRHLLAHTAGYAMTSAKVIAAPGTRRIYSNHGFAVLAEVARAGIGHRVRHLPDRVGLRAARDDRHRRSTAEPRPPGTARRRRSTIWWHSPATCWRRRRCPDRCTTRRRPCSSRGSTACCPASGCSGPTTGGWASRSATANRRTGRGRRTRRRTYGHFGQSGTFLWVDPDAELALVVLTDRKFGEWAHSRDAGAV